tara:strand:+ start:813 stop:1550 length:738 start_codon:yes stop_codon:yes gene_type:complete
MIPKIAIPSHDRPELLQKVLYMIKNYNFKQTPYVFIENKKQLELYKNVKGCKFVITKVKGIQKVRNFIYSYFLGGDFVICFDDSFTGLRKKNKNKLIEFNNLIELCDIGYNEMRKKRTCLFGINIVENPFFMKNKIQFGNYPLSAKFSGFIKQKTKIMHSTNPSGLCEDQETCLNVTSFFGGVVRISGITFNKPQYRKLSGGVQSTFNNTERSEAEKIGCISLWKKFPQLCEIKKSGIGLRYKRI